MGKEIRHSFLINASPESIVAALVREECIQMGWTKEARVENGKGVFGWSGYGSVVQLDIELNAAGDTVVWKCTKSNMQNTQAWEGTAFHRLMAAKPSVVWPSSRTTASAKHWAKTSVSPPFSAAI